MPKIGKANKGPIHKHSFKGRGKRTGKDEADGHTHMVPAIGKYTSSDGSPKHKHLIVG